MPEVPAFLVGTWERIEGLPCADRYPSILRIGANGLYRGHNRVAGRFVEWDDGSLRMSGPHSIAISTANDAILSYTFRLQGDTVEFKSPDGCVFSYRRLD